MMKNKGRSLQWMIGIISGIIVLLFVCVSVWALKMISKDNGPKMQRRIQQVRLIKPPPPPKVKEKPPEPVVKKEEEIIKQEVEETPPPEQAQEPVSDDVPSSDLLGLDADGSNTSDSFGLAAKKGGRSIILGDSGKISPMKRYAWYTRIIEDEITKRLVDVRDFPQDELQVLVKIVLDDQGGIIDHWIYQSSGVKRMDEAVNMAIEDTRMISEPPPNGMPRTIKLRITISG